jgi:hypothetical protein
VLLGAGGLIPVAGAFASTTSFPIVNLIAGATYFIGFQNVEGLLVNFTGYEDPEATNLCGVYYDFDSSNTFSLGPEVVTLALTIAHITPLVALLAGILILIVPRLLNFIVAIYLIIVGLIGLNAIHHFIR